MDIKYFLKRVFSPEKRVKIKRIKRKISSLSKFYEKKTTIDELEYCLREKIKIKKGDNIMVVSSFANLNAAYSPADVVSLLQIIIGEDGLIMMPFYPNGYMYELYKNSFIFDVKQTKSAVGILTNTFAQTNGVVKSMHPLKAVCVWGKDAEAIVQGHEQSILPFGKNTPYGRLLDRNSKSIGLGVKNLPMFHAVEDRLYEKYHPQYLHDEYSMQIRRIDDSIITCTTKIHDPAFHYKAPIGDYVAAMNLESYIRVPFGYSFLYSVNNSEILEAFNKMVDEKKV